MTKQSKYPIVVCKEHQLPGRKYGFPAFGVCDVCGRGEICCQDLTEENLIPIKPTKIPTPPKITTVFVVVAKMIINMIESKIVEDCIMGAFSTKKKAQAFIDRCSTNKPTEYKKFKDGSLLEDCLEARVVELDIDDDLE